jgi:glutamate transport system permease protein
MMQNAKVIVANSTSMLPVYLIVALIYILVNYAISRFARWLSSRSDVKILAA